MKTLLKMLALALTLTLASSAAVAQQSATSGDDSAQTPETDRPIPFPFDGNEADYEQATLLLSDYHGIPPKEIFEGKLDEPKRVLLGIALSDETSAIYRKQALSALGYWPDDTVFALYVRFIEDEDNAQTIRHRAMLLLADHFADRALQKLRPYLSDDELQVRLTAIEAIRRLPSDEAVDALREALKSETHAVAKKRLEQYSQTLR